MPRRRFFILDETCAASEVPSMMCRVVTDRLLPLINYAPIEPLPSHLEARHNTNDIIPSILSAPSLSTNRKDFLGTVRDKAVTLMLTTFFGFDFARTREEQLVLESKEVKRYTLKNPQTYFETLMENDLYARDVRKILKEAPLGRAYMVVGFITTTGATWKRKSIKSSSQGANVTLPVAEALGVPLPEILDPGFEVSHTKANSQGFTMSVVQEEIFAVAYNVVTTKYSLQKGKKGSSHRTPVVGPPKRARAHHLALSPESDEVAVSSDEEDEEDPLLVDFDEAEEEAEGERGFEVEI
jgi:hypothetical protein